MHDFVDAWRTFRIQDEEILMRDQVPSQLTALRALDLFAQ